MAYTLSCGILWSVATVPKQPQRNAATVIAAAEAEGAAYRHPTEQERISTTQVLTRAPGTIERRCVEANDRLVRSGEFSAGAFDYYPWLWRQGVSKMSWRPLIVPAGIDKSVQVSGEWVLSIRATRLDASGNVVEVRGRTLSRGVLGNADPSNFAEVNSLFYSGVGMLLPTPGRWLIVGSAGPNWGCFILTFDGTEPEPKIR
jgi:hypothetical protein